jgi:ElaB/YqjD/DUF883 family membrane-anchored ribosome-binding protein
MTYSEQLEREAERDRANIEETIEELRVRLRPGHLVDQLVDQVRDGAGAEFYENLKRQIVDNPLPVTVIGAGLAWLAISNGMSRRRGAGAAGGGALGNGSWRSRSATEAATDRLHSAEEAARGIGDNLSASARESSERLGQAYDSAADRMRAGTESARARLADAADSMHDSMGRARRSIADASDALAEFSREQPLVVAALGVALGAALGAGLPATEAESRVMGDAAEEAKAKARDIVDEHTDRLKSAAHDAVQHVAERTAENMEATEQKVESNPDRANHASETDAGEQRFGKGESG